MAKILYPVGTKVVIKKNLGSEPQRVGMIATVVGYYKGSDAPNLDGTDIRAPYRIEFTDGHKSVASVKELKRYTPTDPKKTTDEPDKPVEGTATHSDMVRKQKAVCQCDMKDYYTKQDVDNIVDSVVGQIFNEIQTSKQEVLHTVLDMASMTDRNFCNVKKAFKTLNHDDD